LSRNIDNARSLRLQAGTVSVLTLLLSLFVASKGVSSRILSKVPSYAPIIERLPGYSPQTGDPIYFHFRERHPAHVDTAAIRRAGRLVPDDATYFVQAATSGADASNVVLAARLFLLPAVPTRRAAMADWILSYRSPSLPRGLKVARSYRLDHDLRLVKLRRR
jgi:hypothetical protein